MSGISILFPFVASATTIGDLLVQTSSILNALIGILISAAIVGVFWGGVQYLFKEGAEAKAKGIHIVAYGVATIFVMVSIWGIIKILQDTTHTGGGQTVPTPVGPTIQPANF